MRVESAFIESKPPIAVPITVASDPPVTIATASPNAIFMNATAIASFELAQALATENVGPRIPCFIDTLPEAALAMSIGTKKGEIRSYAPVGDVARTVSSTVMMPPIPVAMMTPVSCRTAGSTGKFASAIA